ncbi:DNA-3-methyladenine glycosylase family protein [Actinokineospora bangkokensis]|uniref:DNA-3-methyladenine glycosylase II n=1 Tax=Actinokineospora bangkokensis TaxID=1193682 RepID=A0A1Q9LEK0_9PSEU|nr:3-methyladenine DNA glycosylase [Actinokineospora bangkokensis]OLR90435.1 3-methyladenine DNA glycosylase [Actinokineospora bangkokensis]
MTVAAPTRTWTPAHPLDVQAVLRPLRRGPGDPALRLAADGAWLAANTPAGPGSLHLAVRAGRVEATAWGAGADHLLDSAPGLLGAHDDDTGFTAHHPVVAEVRRRKPGLRLGATGRVWDVLLAAILEQKVTGTEAHRTWAALARRFGTPVHGDLHAPPTPEAVLGIADWQWHKAGLDGARRRALIAAAQVAGRLERAVELRGVEGRLLLRRVPGIGVWTAAEVAQRAWGDPDAVSVGDFHIPHVVGYALVGKRLDDRGMLEVLAPYAGQRQRAVRYVEAAGLGKPRYGPRLSPKDFRAI